jgi:hypothetical protein
MYVFHVGIMKDEYTISHQAQNSKSHGQRSLKEVVKLSAQRCPSMEWCGIQGVA